MNNVDWAIIQTLYETKSITKATQILFLTQPALTRRLHKIEQEFNVKIVNREPKGISFTPEGEYLAKQTKKMLLEYHDIKEGVLALDKNNISGTLQIGASYVFSKYKLPAILEIYNEHYPKVNFNIVTTSNQNVYNMIYNNELPIGFIRENYSWPYEKYLVMEETYCIACKEKINIRDLPYLPRIDAKYNHKMIALLDKWWIANFSKPPRIFMKVENTDICREMILRGLGYSIVSSMLIETIRDRIYTIDLTDENGNLLKKKTWLFFHKQALESNAVRAFVDLFKEFRF